MMSSELAVAVDLFRLWRYHDENAAAAAAYGESRSELFTSHMLQVLRNSSLHSP